MQGVHMSSSLSRGLQRSFPLSPTETSNGEGEAWRSYRPNSTSKRYASAPSLGSIARWMQQNEDYMGDTTNSTGNIRLRGVKLITFGVVIVSIGVYYARHWDGLRRDADGDLKSFVRPAFVNERPYITSTYYSSTTADSTLRAGTEHNPQVHQVRKLAGKSRDLGEGPKTRLAVLRPFCAFDAEALPTTFAAWDSLPPCRAAVNQLGDEDLDLDSDGNEESGSERAAADVFLFYSQTYADSPEAITAVDAIIKTFNEPGGWSECFDNIYAIEANIPAELDLYIPSAQEELYNWVNGPNRQFEAAFRVIQSGEWGNFDGFYLMEGDSIPIKSFWLDRVLAAVDENRPFAIMGAKYNGDKWDQFYEKIPLALIHHINGNGIYNVSHPFLEHLVGQLEVEAPCPYNSIPYDYRMSQMVIEGALGIVPKLAPKIMLDEDGHNITLSNNTKMFAKWWDTWKDENPFKETPVIHNYAATNLIPRHLGVEYIIHGAKLYSPWDPSDKRISLVISEWFADRSRHLLESLDETDHPFSQVVIMLPPDVQAKDEYNETVVPVRTQHRTAPDFMDLCEANIETEWFMITNSYHHVATTVDLMFTPATMKPVVAFTPATYAFCYKFPYCKEAVNLAQRLNPKHDKVVQDMDMLYHTETLKKYCEEWKNDYGDEGQDLYKNDRRALRKKQFIGPKGPTGTGYSAYLFKNGKDGMYKFTDRSLYGARDFFIKVFRKEEKLDALTPEELAKRVGLTLLTNETDCDCSVFESQDSCQNSGLGCEWREKFDTCHAPAMIDDGTPICPETLAPSPAPTPEDDYADDIDSMAVPSEPEDVSETDSSGSWYSKFFNTREHTDADTIDGGQL